MHRIALTLLTATALAAGCHADKALAPAVPGPSAAAAPPRVPEVYRLGKASPVPGRTQTGRYSFLVNGTEAAQADPLLVIIDVGLPSSLSTVEDAADYLLKRSGYCLMDPATREVKHLFGLPLPSVHRHLGPMTLRDALLALGGRAYELVVDDVYREVGYRVAATQAGGTL